MLFDCPLTANIRESNNQQNETLADFFAGTDYVRIATTIKAIEKQMKI